MPTITTGFGVVPARLPSDRPREARELLARDGAVILTGLGTDPGDLAVAAALVLGERLRRIFPHRLRRSPEGGTVHLHADSFDIVGDTGGGPERRRDPDEDHVRAMIDRFRERVREMEPSLPRVLLGEGECLVLDNYRCWHGRDPHEGERAVQILTVLTADAR